MRRSYSAILRRRCPSTEWAMGAALGRSGREASALVGAAGTGGLFSHWQQGDAGLTVAPPVNPPAPAPEAIPNVLAERYASAAMKENWSATGRILLERDFWIAVMKAQKD